MSNPLARSGLLLLCLALAWCCCVDVRAQENQGREQSPAAEVQPPPRPARERVRVEVWGGGVGQADLEGSQGGFSLFRTGLALDYADFKFAYARKVYSWDDNQHLPFGNRGEDPWTGFQALGVSFRRFGPVTPQWMYFAGGGVSSSFEDGASGLVGPRAFGGFTYAGSPGWQVSLGLGVFHNRVHDTILPMIGANWNRGRGSGRDAAGWAFSLGFPETSVAYRFNSTVRLRLGLSFDRDIYQLCGGNPASPGGYLETQDLIGGLYLDLAPADRFRLTFGLQHVFGRELTLYDRDERELRTYDVDSSLGGVINAVFVF
ncbi:MAG: hypothetical protein KKB20_21135 [Proteobacteria bacterium]|nr:hypothetical protein [Pseudomonadota bacterium]